MADDRQPLVEGAAAASPGRCGLCAKVAAAAVFVAGGAAAAFHFFAGGGNGHLRSDLSRAEKYLSELVHGHFRQSESGVIGGLCAPGVGDGPTGDGHRDFDAMRDYERAEARESTAEVRASPPAMISRDQSIYERCACKKGLNNVTLWPDNMPQERITVSVGDVRWVRWNETVTRLRWFCDGMNFAKSTKVQLDANEWLSLHMEVAEKQNKLGPIGCCHGKPSGFLLFNTWLHVDYTTSVPFTSGTEGFSCFKIPAVLRTQSGAFIAFAEARRNGCSDFSSTSLVYKRSTDGGLTWSACTELVTVSEEEQETLGLCGKPLVIGNVAPVQLGADSPHHPGRILAPYTRNNFKHWLVYSDDDGVTWEGDRELENMTVTDPDVAYDDAEPDCDRGMSYFGFDHLDYLNWSSATDVVRFTYQLCSADRNPYSIPKWSSKLSGPWQFVGAGPPGALQLRGGRVLVPSYHSYIRGLEGNGTVPISQLYNDFALGHTLISDDGGDTWTLSTDWEIGQGANENQMVELTDGTVLTNSRSLATGSPQWRVQARSSTNGSSFEASTVTSIQQPFNGCQGSTISGGDDVVYVASPDPKPATSWLQEVVKMIHCDVNLTGRSRVTVWKSTDGGRSYPSKTLVDPGLSAQTSLQHHDGKLFMLYEQADPAPQETIVDRILEQALQNLRILLPSRFVFREVDA